MQLTSVKKIEQFFTDYHETNRSFLTNLSALETLRPDMEKLRSTYPQLFQSYTELVRRGKIEQITLERLGKYHACFNPLGLMDLAASVGVSRWMFDAYVFSRRIAGVL